MATAPTPPTTGIEPWLSVQEGERLVRFYKAAFSATETYRLEMPDGGLVVRLAVGTGGFWISGQPNERYPPSTGAPVRMILTVSDPDAVFEKSVQAGASIIFPVEEAHGWRLGRIADPAGLHWEIGLQLAAH
jgi:PhnB protein